MLKYFTTLEIVVEDVTDYEVNFLLLLAGTLLIRFLCRDRALLAYFLGVPGLMVS